MLCDTRKLNQTKPAGYISGTCPSCIAAPLGFFIGSNSMELTQERLHKALEYDINTGVFTWKNVNKHHKQLNGRIAGCIRVSRGKKYRWIGLDGIKYSAHRLAWFHVHGYWPNIIDHKNGETLYNPISNLNDVDVTMNTQNHKTKVKYSGLPTGVRVLPSGNFLARIKANKKELSLGTYKTVQEADSAYRRARKQLHYCPVENYNENF